MKKMLMVIGVWVFAVTITGLIAADEPKNIVPTANLDLLTKQNIYSNGDYIEISGTGFAFNDEIVATLMIIQNRDGSQDIKVLKNSDLYLDAGGNLSGSIVLEGIDRTDKTAWILVSSYKSNVLPTGKFSVRGDLKHFSTMKPTRGTSFGFDEASGDNIAQLNEQFDIVSSSSDWNGNVISCVRREYDSNDILLTSVGLSIDDLSISGGQLQGFTNNGSTAYQANTDSMSLAVMDLDFTFASSDSGFSTVDNISPQISSAVATSLTNIRITFDEEVEESGGDAAYNFDLTGTDVGTASPNSLSVVGSSPSITWDLSLTGSLANRGPTDLTVTYDTTNTGGTGVLQDISGNEVAHQSSSSVSDQIAPATPTLDTPTSTTIFGAIVDLQATAESSTQDPSIDSVRFEGSDNQSSWFRVGVDINTVDATYRDTYSLGTKYAYYRAVAYDRTLTANSASSADLSDAYRIEFVDTVATLDAGQRGRFRIKLQNNYTDSVTFGSNLVFNLSTSQPGTGTFYDAASGGSEITQVVINTGNYSAVFWYADLNDDSDPTLTVTEPAANLPDNSDQTSVHINATDASYFKVFTENGETETAGTPFDVTVVAFNSSNDTATSYVGTHNLTWTTSATASPDGTSPSIPSDGDRTFDAGVLTIANGATLYRSIDETPWIRVTNGTITTADTVGAGQAITVNTGVYAEVRIKTADETGNGDYDTNVFDTLTVQGPTQAVPDDSVSVFSVHYDNYGNLLTDASGLWGKSADLDGAYNNSGLQIDNVYVFSSGANAGTVYTGTLSFVSTQSSLADNTGTITVDDDDGSSVSGFTVTTDNDDQRFIFASWNGGSSGDDSTTGIPADFEIRWTDESNGQIDSVANWNAATSVGTTGKPSFSAGLWHIDMSSFPPGNKFFAIRTFDDVGNISKLRSGAWTTSSDYSLPVDLISFEAQQRNREVLLTWETASEQDNDGFFIYRSDDENEEFRQLNQQIISGQGNSNTNYTYTYIDTDVEEEMTYYYKLISKDYNGKIHEYGKIVSTTVLALPKSFKLSQNYPNPFNPNTYISFDIPKSSTVTLEIYNMLGQKIKTLINNEQFEPGVYNNIQWNAENDHGDLVSTGIYYLVFSVKEVNYRQVRKLVYTR